MVSADFDGDRRNDLFFWNSHSGANRMERRVGVSGTPVTFSRLHHPIDFHSINGDEYTKVVAGDFNFDGKDDLYFWNPATGANKLAYAFSVTTWQFAVIALIPN